MVNVNAIQDLAESIVHQVRTILVLVLKLFQSSFILY